MKVMQEIQAMQIISNTRNVRNTIIDSNESASNVSNATVMIFYFSMCNTQACVGKAQYFVFKDHNYTTKRGPYAVNSDRYRPFEIRLEWKAVQMCNRVTQG